MDALMTSRRRRSCTTDGSGLHDGPCRSEGAEEGGHRLPVSLELVPAGHGRHRPTPRGVVAGSSQHRHGKAFITDRDRRPPGRPARRGAAQSAAALSGSA